MNKDMKEINRFRADDSGTDAIRERLREVRIGEHQRLIAEAHLARAEAIADLLARAIQSVRGATRALRARLDRPWQRIASALR